MTCDACGAPSQVTWSNKHFCLQCWTTVGFWGNPMPVPPAPEVPAEPDCPHMVVSIDEATMLGIELFGGSWQVFWDKLAKRGILPYRRKQ